MTAREIFLVVLNMSITAGWMIPVILVFRLLMRNFPRVFSYLLWAAVFIRLLCPVSFSSTVSFFSLFGLGKGEEVPITPVTEYSGVTTTSAIDWATTETMHNNDLLPFVAALWMIGVSLMLVHALYSLIRLLGKVRSAQPVGKGLYMCDTVDIPFVLGIIKPAIYLPTSVTGEEYRYILLHEQIHLHRKDYIIKAIAYLALCIHWFNPLVWLSFWLMTRDMEMSCDELVLRKMGVGIKKNYSMSLLIMADAEKQPHSLYSIAFGENDTKRRINNVLNYKHPATKRVVVAICLVAAVSLAVLSNPTAIYAAAEPIVTAPSVIVNSSPSLILATQTPPSAPMTEEQTGTDKLPEDATVNLTLKWPVDGGYVAAGMYSYRGHTGMDIAALHGTEIYAAGSGTVVYASNKNVWPYGRHVIIDHGDGYQTLYAHCSEVLVEPDTEVVQGELIAKVGRTGNASGNHCHIEVRLNGEELDPKDFIEIPSK